MTPEFATWLRGPAMLDRPTRLEGRYLRFQHAPTVAHHESWDVISRRGLFQMGVVEWSPQWGAWSFKPHCDSRFPLTALAEVYAFIRDLGGRQV